FFFFSSRRRHTRLQGDWSSDVCSSDSLSKTHRLIEVKGKPPLFRHRCHADSFLGLETDEPLEIIQSYPRPLRGLQSFLACAGQRGSQRRQGVGSRPPSGDQRIGEPDFGLVQRDPSLGGPALLLGL